ncbi:MAG: hypothetical protein II023_04520 [Prevotella sp.]|nr:hypothetical protein [Prevotella sp.]
MAKWQCGKVAMWHLPTISKVAMWQCGILPSITKAILCIMQTYGLGGANIWFIGRKYGVCLF